MLRHLKSLTRPYTLHLWADPHEAMAIVANWNSVRSERGTIAMKVLHAVFANGDNHPERPQPNTVPFPTDVPVPEPHDVPVPEPMDPPPADPGEKPPARPGQDPQPRPIP
jgi:hypothetical protein